MHLGRSLSVQRLEDNVERCGMCYSRYVSEWDLGGRNVQTIPASTRCRVQKKRQGNILKSVAECQRRWWWVDDCPENMERSATSWLNFSQDMEVIVSICLNLSKMTHLFAPVALIQEQQWSISLSIAGGFGGRWWLWKKRYKQNYVLRTLWASCLGTRSHGPQLHNPLCPSNVNCGILRKHA